MPTTNPEILSKFLTTLRHAQKLSPMTVDSYRWKLGQLFRWMQEHYGDLPLAQWKFAHFEDFLADQKWTSLRSRNKLLHQTRKFLRWCIAREILPANFDITGDYKTAKIARGKPKFISREDLIRLLDETKGNRMEVAIGLCALAGLRRSEAAAVRWSDLDWEKQTIRVESPKTARTGDHSVRTLDLSARLLDILTRHRGERLDTDTILNFPCFGGLSGNGNRSLRALCKRLNMTQIGFHNLRHTCATLQVRAGIDIATVRDFLGHKDLEMTSIYTWSDNKSMKRAANAVL